MYEINFLPHTTFQTFSASMHDKELIIGADLQSKLIAGCIAGNRSCQSELYKLFSPKMMVVCMRYSKNLEEAEEILQDGFMRVFTCIGQFKQEGSFEGWIRKIMVNCALLKLRSQINMKPVSSLNADLHEHHYSNDIIENINGKELLKLVQALPPAYRMVFNLFYFEGMKHREIAELLHIEIGTSKSNLAQAKRILQTALTQQLKFTK